MSLRKYQRRALRAAGLMTRTVKVSRVNRVTGLSELREETHRLSATGHGQQKPNPSTPGAGFRAAIRRLGGGKGQRRSKIATRRALRDPKTGGAF